MYLGRADMLCPFVISRFEPEGDIPPEEKKATL